MSDETGGRTSTERPSLGGCFPQTWRDRAPNRRRGVPTFLWGAGGVLTAATAFVVLHPEAFFTPHTGASAPSAASVSTPSAAMSASAAVDASAGGTTSSEPSPPLFCKDSKGVFQPFQRTDLARLDAAFQRVYGWSRFDLPGGTEKDGTPYRVIAYAKDHDSIGTESILFALRDYNDGLALLLSLAKFPGKSPQTTEGTDMCWAAFGIVNDPGGGAPNTPPTSSPESPSGRASAPVTGWTSQ